MSRRPRPDNSAKVPEKKMNAKEREAFGRELSEKRLRCADAKIAELKAELAKSEEKRVDLEKYIVKSEEARTALEKEVASLKAKIASRNELTAEKANIVRDELYAGSEESMSDLSSEQQDVLKKVLWVAKEAGDKVKFNTSKGSGIAKVYLDPWGGGLRICCEFYNDKPQQTAMIHDTIRGRCLFSATFNGSKWVLNRFDKMTLWPLFLEACVSDVREDSQ